MLPKDFLKSKNIPEPTYNGVRLVDNEMEAYKITDLLYEYALITLKEVNEANKGDNAALILPDVSVSAAPNWYDKDCLYNHLRNNNYSEEIANELADMYAKDLQLAFEKGFQKGQQH